MGHSPANLAASAVAVRATDQLEFDFLLGDRQFFTFQAAAQLTGMSDSFLEKLWDDSRHALHIAGHEYNAGRGHRQTKRIARPFLARLLVATATYTADERRAAVTSLARIFSAAECRMIAEAFARAATSKQ